jgi:D-alanyl-D-alanine carboxypeptidase
VRSSLGRYRWAGGLGVLAGGATAVALLLHLGDLTPPASEPAVLKPATPVETGSSTAFREPLAGGAPEFPAPGAVPSGEGCQEGPSPAAAANALSLRTLVWAPYNRTETGWEIYAPQIAAEINATCGPETPGFAASMVAWQGANGLPATGRLDPAVYAVMNTRWLLARPFVIESRSGCPQAAALDSLVALEPQEIYGKPERLERGALSAYRRMIADARAQIPALAANKRMLTVFSGYREPDADAARCALEQDCQGVTRTICSAHRTGRAIDLMVGHAPGQRPDSSNDANRLAQTRTPAYLWLVSNAKHYGFVNYTFEPWHWEWTGQT